MLVYNLSTMESRAPRVGHKKSRNGCAQCKRRHVKVSRYFKQKHLDEVVVESEVAWWMKKFFGLCTAPSLTTLLTFDIV